MRMHALHARLYRRLFQDLVERVAGHRTTQAGQKDKPRANRLRPTQLAQTSHLASAEGLHAIVTALRTPHPQPASVEIDLRPLQTDKLAGTQTMPVRHQDHYAIPVVLGSPDQALNLIFGEVFALTIQNGAWCWVCSA